jgi:dTDP-4-amino-4,6-dideoxygalactose transaminase
MGGGKRIRLGYNAVPESAEVLIKAVFESGQFSPGPMVRKFEKAWAALHGSKHAIFVNSGTDALRLGLLALKEQKKWPDGASVALPATTFVATVNVILQAGLQPFLVDVGQHDFLINPWNLERRITTGGTMPNIVAVMPVHLFGQRCGEEIYEMARRYKWAVLEDSCETVANKTRGDVSCHSTYMAHHVTTGVGGFACTNDDELNLIIRSLANHGRNTDYIPGYVKGSDIKRRFQFDRVGFSCRGTEFEAALGLSQLKDLNRNIKKRKAIFNLLRDKLSLSYEFALVNAEGNTCMMFPLVAKESSNIDKWKLCEFLEKNGIETREMMPILGQPCYPWTPWQGPYSVSEWIRNKGFYLPCHPQMTAMDVCYIVLKINQYLKYR